MFLKNKKILLGLSSSIAVQKVPALISILKDRDCEVEVIATENALKLIDRDEIESVLGKKIWVAMFDCHSEHSEKSQMRDTSQAQDDVSFPHIDLAKWADVFLIAPATANLIGKIANGLADDLLSTLLLVYPGDVFVAPAMNCNMWNNEFFQMNLKKLAFSGQRSVISILEPQEGKLACGDEGIGRMMEPADIVLNLENYFEERNLLKGKKILITAGATREYIDPVRYITNGSSGKMGMALAREACKMGAEVVLVSGNLDRNLKISALDSPPARLDQFGQVPIRAGQLSVLNIETTEQMFEAVKDNIEGCDAFISAAAVCDFKPVAFSDKKIKKRDPSLKLKMTRTQDILKSVGNYKKSLKLKANSLQLKVIGFALETENLIENARQKLIDKNADLIIANQPVNIGADEGEFYFVDKKSEKFVKGSKSEVAKEILKQLLQLGC